jgi:hypothetical protein
VEAKFSHGIATAWNVRHDGYAISRKKNYTKSGFALTASPARESRSLDAPCKILQARVIERLLTDTTKMRLIIITMMVAALVGCATTRLENDVKPYVGRNIHELSVRLGKPTGMRESGERVFVWSADSEGVLPTSSGADTRTGTMTAHYECTLEVTVNAQNIIQSYEVEGSNAGCAAFRRHLIR